MSASIALKQEVTAQLPWLFQDFAFRPVGDGGTTAQVILYGALVVGLATLESPARTPALYLHCPTSTISDYLLPEPARASID